MKKSIITIAALAFLFASCGGKKDADKTNNPFEKLANDVKNLDNNIKTSTNAADQKLKDRRAKGDTLAMPYADLIKYLPTAIDGYKSEEPTGKTMNMTGMSTSNAEVTFTNDNGNRIHISIVDYNAAYSYYTGLTAMWAMGMSIDSPDEIAKGVKMDNDIAGWEEYRKKTKDATVTLGIGYRFYLQIEASNQDGTDNIKNIAKSMDLAKLASM
ncbi:MAG: hypothetical protein HY064_01760 [Bacteroidetes bacterium]|nr:hypothetical protein [Bacteroidota bacterium]